MAIGPDEIYDRIVTGIEARLGSSVVAAADGPWRVSRHSWDHFRELRDSRTIAHHSFAVGMPVGDGTIAARQHAGVGNLTREDLSIRWAHRLRADAMSADYQAALAAEVLLVAALKSIDTLAIRVGTRHERIVTPDERTFIGEVRGTLIHYYPLA